MNALPKLTDGDTCPHCGARAVVEPSAALRWACGVCGGARIRGLSKPPSEPVVASLVSARHARAGVLGWNAAAIGFALVGVLAGALAVLLAFVSHLAGGVVGVIVVACAILALSARRSGARAKARSIADLDAAYAAAAEQIARERGGALTSADLAQAMHVDVAAAEAILGVLAVQSNVRVDVGDDAELHYRIDPREPVSAGDTTSDASAPPAQRAQREP